MQLPQTYTGDPAHAAALTELALERTTFPDGECAKQFYRRNMRLSVLEFMEEVGQGPKIIELDKINISMIAFDYE